jgi:magnesium transporter
MSPHPNNVRRRIRQLNNFISISADWICYGMIDDITDCYVPLISQIEDDVDDIDDAILRLHSEEQEDDAKRIKSFKYANEKAQEGEDKPPEGGERDMLRRVGNCRKKVMGLYRLLSNKADVIKGFAKRCTERYDVAPGGDIGFYLGDIQDHIITMTGNLGHYEK